MELKGRDQGPWDARCGRIHYMELKANSFRPTAWILVGVESITWS